MVTEKPIIMSGPMVRALLEGRKTMTRRVMNPQPVHSRNGWFNWDSEHGAPKASSPRLCAWHAETWQREAGTAPLEDYCPYGRVNSKLWIRETWAPILADTENGGILYRADYSGPGNPYPCDLHRGAGAKWKPSIYMPRVASRITLEITDIKVERLRDISVADIQAEGIDLLLTGDTESGIGWRNAWRKGWDAINGKRPGCSWQDSPWVWVITFRKL
jgi:hypothetical protein